MSSISWLLLWFCYWSNIQFSKIKLELLTGSGRTCALCVYNIIYKYIGEIGESKRFSRLNHCDDDDDEMMMMDIITVVAAAAYSGISRGVAIGVLITLRLADEWELRASPPPTNYRSRVQRYICTRTHAHTHTATAHNRKNTQIRAHTRTHCCTLHECIHVHALYWRSTPAPPPRPSVAPETKISTTFSIIILLLLGLSLHSPRDYIIIIILL